MIHECGGEREITPRRALPDQTVAGRVRPVTASALDGSALCTHCGHCCSGTVVAYASLGSEEEVARGRRLRLPIYEKETGGSAFTLPCPRIEERRCGVYDDRPRSCRDYQCKLLQRFLAGEIALAEALGVVERLGALTDRVRAQLGPQDPTASVFVQTDAYVAALGPDAHGERSRREHAAFWLDMVELEMLLRRQFSRDD
jgi:uncharacterized protein